ncbi:uncharacterized protein LOC106882459 [Octopus bimaculoides]|nr:uncharacterized protein LOC106882459 [Octopus bimaculoides]|eukprot:XP_014788631.1 PREDICTED: uncharacterized protein LOC106882459 [Octopus bimaculoides]
MKEHLHKVKNHVTFAHYLGKGIQNELIQLIASATQKKTIEVVQAAKYFSIILDCTPIVSHVEQMTMIIHFVDLGKNNEEMAGNIHTEKSEMTVREHFLGFILLKEATGAFITDTILEKLHEVSLSVENLCGQGFDNGSNMKDKDNGVQRRLLNINLRAYFVPCNTRNDQ